MINFFDINEELDLTNVVCHSGGADGADTCWETLGQKWGVKTKAYSYKTKGHKSPNKVEISEEDYIEGIEQVKRANKFLCRFGIEKYMNLLARNWAQVKYSKEIFAIGTFIEPGQKNDRGYTNKSKLQIVDGGTGYATMMAIINQKPVFLFDQVRDKWFKWSFLTESFVQLDQCPKIGFQDFAGIGTRQLCSNGIMAINDVYKKTFDKENV